MKLLVALSLLAVVSCSSVTMFTQYNPAGTKTFDEYWEEFKYTHSKKYATSEEEEMRKEIFSANVKHVEMHNYLFAKGKKTFKLGISEYSDMEREEFNRVMNGYKSTNRSRSEGATFLPPLNMAELPDHVDWRIKGYVTPVKNQGQCGSCWAFSTTGSLEGQHFRKTKKLVSLSEQNLVDCTTGCYGCDGGLPDLAFEYIKENHGIDTEASYPYTAVEGNYCLFKKRNVGATDKGYTDLPEGSEADLKTAVATVGPISVAINAAADSFRMYSSGVYYDPPCPGDEHSLDHAVLVVGYGTDPVGGDYWLVKNSWGETWGDNGYIKMARNRDNYCGIATAASYPLV